MMSREPVSESVPYFKVADVEHPHNGAEVDVSGASSLSFKNPVVVDCEFREDLEMFGDSEKSKRDITKVDIARSSSSSMEESFTPKKTHKFKFKTCCEWAVIGTVIAMLWGILILLCILYRTFEVQGGNVCVK